MDAGGSNEREIHVITSAANARPLQERRIDTLAVAGNKRNLPNMSKAIVGRSPDILGGTPVFAGTRVPIQTLIDYLEGGESIDDFLKGFPTVTRQQVIAFLEEAKTRVVASGA